MNANFKPAKAKANPAYLAKVRALPCCICQAFGEMQTSPTEAHHVICGRYGTRKTPDEMAIPLCRGHHLGDFDTSKLSVHRDRAAWVQKYGPDIDYIAATQDAILGD
jgi:hypothetical protein